MAVNKRNEPCSCGSGKKHKQCCARAARGRDSQWMLYGVGALLAVGIVWGLGSAIIDASNPPERPAAPPGKVWNAEHGHFHDATSLPLPADAGQPAGPAPAGKVWNEEHGHHHDAPASPGSADGADVAPTSDPG